MKTLEELTTRRQELEAKAEEVQSRHAEHEFSIELEDRKMMKTLMSHLDKGYTWKTANAAVVVTLYDKLKSQYNDAVKSDKQDTDAVTVSLRGHELNGLYQALLNVEGTGVESARKFIRMLTLVGETVTEAMSTLADMNSEIHAIHQELGQLDAEIEAASVDVVSDEDLELVQDEAEK